MEPITRSEIFLANIAGEQNELPAPQSRIEYYLNAIAQAGDIHGGSAGAVIYDKDASYPDGSVGAAMQEMDGEISENTSDISQLKSQIEEIVSEENTDLLYGQPSRDSWFIDPSTGVGRTLANFYSYENIVIPAGTKFLYPYNNNSADHKYIRSICFYEEDGTFISGVSGGDSNVTNGVQVPDNTYKLSCSLNAPNAGFDGKHYLSTIPGENKVILSLDPDVQLDSKQINVSANLANNVRMPCINFQFDDGSGNDEYIVDIFDTFGMKCGFAIISNVTNDNRTRYLQYQEKGYEIMSHSTDTAGMSDATVDPSVIEEKLKNSKATLESLKFNIRGFVTPNSTMADVFKPILRKYYQWAATVYYGDYTGTGKPHLSPIDGAYNIKRVSLQGTTLANQKAAVDECIAKYGCLTFYGHSASLDTTDNLTTENLNALLTYIGEKVTAGMCIVGTPSEVIDNYFAVRNDDVADGWSPWTFEEASVDARLSKVAWSCQYNDHLGLIWFSIRLKATEAISGQTYPLFSFPRNVPEGQLIANNANRECISYGGNKVLLATGNWADGTSYRFSGVLKMERQ